MENYKAPRHPATQRDIESLPGMADRAMLLATGGIAHDFNNLLQVMSGHLDVLQVGLDRPDAVAPARLQTSMAQIRHAVEDAARLTQHLLAFARKQYVQGRVMALNAPVKSTLAMGRRSLGRDVALTMALADELWNCKVDATQLDMALLNLLFNARDAMAGKPGGEVVVRTENVLLAADELPGLELFPAGRYVCLSVSDNGVGIDPALLERIMDPFFTTKGEGRGSGLGLSMVRSFAEQSQGAVSIRSVPGQGATVSLYFPAVDEPAMPADAAPAQGKESILIVDDRLEVAEVAQAMLEMAGYTTRIAQSARSALQILETHADIDLLFTDVMMPGGVTGVALAREARRRWPALKVLLTTGLGGAVVDGLDDTTEGAEAVPENPPAQPQEAAHARPSARVFEVIFKPYHQTDLAQRVRQLLDVK